jgi:RNA polymerase sigma factor (sigma-70 family)
MSGVIEILQLESHADLAARGDADMKLWNFDDLSKTRTAMIQSLADCPQLDEFWNKYYQAMFNRALVVCRRKGARDYESIAAETCRRILTGIREKLHSYDVSRPFRPWLAAVTKNQCIEVWRVVRRHERRFGPISEVEIEGTEIAPDEAVGNQELRQSLRKLVWRECEPRARTVYINCFENKLTAGEVARQLGVSESTVRRDKRELLARLRSYRDALLGAGV